ncbi:hypothetical protein [Marinicellulosiphila megalodicopiae]|uniref:hypothetical protein n=1 Tax=Marinicellulosiphila megalodicopiae TaxID=2724896 RepID=UPI003BB09E25
MSEKNNKTKSWLNQIVIVFFMLIFLYLIPKVYQFGMANAFYFKSQYYIAKWIKDQDSFSQSGFDDAFDAAQRAYLMDSNNAHYLLNFAKIQELGWYYQVYTPEADQLILLYQQAIDMRPKWPNAYGDYAYSLAFIKQDTQAAFDALKQGLSNGSFAKSVHENVILIGFSFWNDISFSDKQMTLSSTLILINSNDQSVYQSLKSSSLIYNKLSILCSYFENNPSKLNALGKKRVNQDICSFINF